MPVVEQFASNVMLAWNGKLTFPELISRASELQAEGFVELAAVLYQTWLARVESPFAHAVQFNLGVALASVNDLAGAEAAYRNAMAIVQNFPQPRLNLGLILERRGKVNDALTEWKWIVGNCPRDEAGRPMVQLALNHIGRVLEVKKQLPESESHLTQSLLLEPDQPDVLHHWVFLRQKQCAWPVYTELAGVSKEAMREATSALSMLSLSDDPFDQLHAAELFVETKLAKNLPRLTNGFRYRHSKLRIAYCSSDFCLHPVSLLTVQLFELHNRDAFEVYGFCWSPEDGSTTRQRVKAAMDRFYTIHQLSDEAAAQLIRSHEIDILVDLQGQTSGARANILGYRPAPLQITYLGLPATTGFPTIDYVIADEFLIPRSETRFYSEKPLYMPSVYQVSDRNRVSGPRPTRASCALPEKGFVFCSFNNSYKYTPEVFAVWLTLLQQVPGSVLWLLADNPSAEKNLRQVAESHGVLSDRLVFATRVSLESYLARYLIADLFLDTFPFNAGTTANDCLWMGCPLVTYAGRSFGSRMAGALLTVAGLPELITYNLADYAALALDLAKDPARCVALRDKLAAVRENGALFDTPQFVRDLEQRLQALVADLPLAPLVVSAP